ncbi:hypothetical protein CRG98_021010 [Punica granatum]|uniref:Uncharacterized protein n=1 Tax=Punica granatum TaxID=22663 RepID=A0A2I0JQU7_PUNGR|nr:hypothetical protein CRG98_021010 [Punica granatum]
MHRSYFLNRLKEPLPGERAKVAPSTSWKSLSLRHANKLLPQQARGPSAWGTHQNSLPNRPEFPRLGIRIRTISSIGSRSLSLGHVPKLLPQQDMRRSCFSNRPDFARPEVRPLKGFNLQLSSTSLVRSPLTACINHRLSRLILDSIQPQRAREFLPGYAQFSSLSCVTLQPFPQ